VKVTVSHKFRMVKYLSKMCSFDETPHTCKTMKILAILTHSLSDTDYLLSTDHGKAIFS
jgi:hypothetical protein